MGKDKGHKQKFARATSVCFSIHWAIAKDSQMNLSMQVLLCMNKFLLPTEYLFLQWECKVYLLKIFFKA